MSKSQEKLQGTVKFFDEKKGFGFITPERGGKDDFVHVSAVERAGIETLKTGDRVEYELREHRGRFSADHLRLVEAA